MIKVFCFVFMNVKKVMDYKKYCDISPLYLWFETKATVEPTLSPN